MITTTQAGVLEYRGWADVALEFRLRGHGSTTNPLGAAPLLANQTGAYHRRLRRVRSAIDRPIGQNSVACTAIRQRSSTDPGQTAGIRGAGGTPLMA